MAIGVSKVSVAQVLSRLWGKWKTCGCKQFNWEREESILAYNLWCCGKRYSVGAVGVDVIARGLALQGITDNGRCLYCCQPPRPGRKYCSDKCWYGHRMSTSFYERGGKDMIVGKETALDWAPARKPFEVTCMRGDWADEMENL